eukprot:scaffold6788_cov71-Cyclotella_meneghiniana.AAC.4
MPKNSVITAIVFSRSSAAFAAGGEGTPTALYTVSDSKVHDLAFCAAGANAETEVRDAVRRAVVNFMRSERGAVGENLMV